MTPATPETRRLAEELTALRERTGLSLAALADRTSVSKSAWHRYLRGDQLPPRGVVEELCALAEERPGRLLALWDVAETVHRGRHGRSPAAPAPAPSPTRRDADVPAAAAEAAGEAPARRRAGRTAWAALGGALAGGALLGVLGVTVLSTEPSGPPDPGCRAGACTGADPEMNGCTHPEAEFTTVARHAFPGGAHAEIRYSSHCDAAWARVWLGAIGDAIELRVPGQPEQRAEIADRYAAEAYVYTPMTAGRPEQGRACLLPADTASEQCFGP